MEDYTSSLFFFFFPFTTFYPGRLQTSSILDTLQIPCSHQGSKPINILQNQAHPFQVKSSAVLLPAEAAQTKAQGCHQSKPQQE